MPRASLSHKDAMGGGIGFQEGTLHITKSRVAVHRFPPSNKDGKQGDAFTCVRWTAEKLDNDLNVMDEQDSVILALRLGKPENVRPGLLKEKDFDDLDVQAKDLGSEIDTEGNSLVIDEGQKIESIGWAVMEASLVKNGFKEAVAGRGIATDYEGLVAHFHTDVETYVAKKDGRNIKAGETGKSYSLVCDRIHRFPYDKTSKVNVGGKTGKSKKDEDEGGDEEAGSGSGSGKVVKAAVEALEKVGDQFKAKICTGKPIDKKVFYMAAVKEFMRQDVDDKLQSEIMDALKSKDGLKAIAKEAGFKVGEDTVTFAAEEE